MSHARTSGAGGVLFVTYGGGHVDIVVALLPRLQALGVPCGVLALTTAAIRLRAAAQPFATPLDYLPLEGYEQALDLGAELSAPLWDPTGPLSWDESCAYLGISMLDLIASHGEAEAWQRYRQQGRKAFCPTRFLGCVLVQEQPRVVVTTCLVRMERAATLAARQRGCRSLLIEDLFGFSLLGPAGLQGDPTLAPRHEWPDAVVVLNEQVRARIVDAGFPKAAVHALGQPVFADWLQRWTDAQPCAPLLDWCNQGRPVVTYAAPSRAEVWQRHARALLQIARRHPEWGLVVKLHPSVGLQAFDTEVGERPDNLRVLPAEQDILPVLKASDLVVVFRSTVGLLSLFAGLPLLVFDDSDEPELMPYVSSGAAVAASTPAQLERAMVQLLAAPTSAGGARQQPLFENPPMAAERIAVWLQAQLQP